jgi:hypothetical protein
MQDITIECKIQTNSQYMLSEYQTLSSQAIAVIHQKITQQSICSQSPLDIIRKISSQLMQIV